VAGYDIRRPMREEDCKAEYCVAWKRDKCSFVLSLARKADWCVVTNEEWLAKVEIEADGAQKP
jgi:hypothetical protein